MDRYILLDYQINWWRSGGSLGFFESSKLKTLHPVGNCRDKPIIRPESKGFMADSFENKCEKSEVGGRKRPRDHGRAHFHLIVARLEASCLILMCH